MKRAMNAIFLSGIAVILLSVASPGQDPAPAPVRPRLSNPAQKPEVEPLPKTESSGEPAVSEEQMRRAIINLSAQIDSLNVEIKRLRRTTERNSQAIELLLSEERLAKVEDKLDAATERKAALDAREAEILRRQKTIPQEATQRGFLRRDEGEAILRAEYQRALDDTHNQQQQVQQRIAELQAQVTTLRARVDTLRRRLERLEERSDEQQQQQ